MNAFFDTQTYDIVSMGVSYMRLSVGRNCCLGDYLERSNTGPLLWHNYYKFQDDLLAAFQEMGVPCSGDYWAFIEKYMSGYTWSDEVLHTDIVERYLHGELDDEKDIEWVESEFKDRQEMKTWLDEMQSKFFQFALFDFFMRTNHR